MKLAPLEERIYRHRCVEAWSIVVPWIGFPLSNLIKKVEPTSKAKYVQFFTALDPKQMPWLRQGGLDWPYREGLRLDEAMHPLTLLCFGLYGEVLPNQNGAPLRTIIPWKYGFKSTKSIVRMRFLQNQPENDLEHDELEGIRLLLQRESECGLTRAGARPANGAWTAPTSARKSRRRCSTATPTRWPACTRAWT